MDNKTRRNLLQRHKGSDFPGSIIDVFKAYEQGVDLIGQYQQQMQVANTPQQQQQGLRPQHQAGNTNASMAFPNTPPNASFNTVGMKAPINMKQYDDFGNLVKSYDRVPPGVTDLKMSSKGGTVIETPAQMKTGGIRKLQSGDFLQPDNTRVSTPTPQTNPTLNPPKFEPRSQGTITQAPYDSNDFWRSVKANNLQDDSTFENIVEAFDPTGISSWDDAYRAMNSMNDRGALYPNLDETLDMFGALPILGKAKYMFNLSKANRPLKYYGIEFYNKVGRRAINSTNVIDALEDETGFLDNMRYGGVRKYQSGGQLAPIYTTNPKDPRLQAYNDSLDLYNSHFPPDAFNRVLNEIKTDPLFRYYRPSTAQELNAFPGEIKPVGGTQFDTQRLAADAISDPNTPYSAYVALDENGRETPNSVGIPMSFKRPVQPVIHQELAPLTPRAIPSNTYSGKELRESNVTLPKYSGREAQPMMRADFSKGIARQGQYQIGERYWDDDKKRWKEDRWSPEETKESKRIAIEGLEPPRTYIGKFEFGYGGKRKYQNAGPLDVSVTTPDWRATGPATRIDGQIYQPSELTGGTRIMTNPETKDPLPVMLPAAEIVGRRNYDDSIQEAISRTNSGLLGSRTSAQDYEQMENAVRSGMNTAGDNMLAAALDLSSAPQRYLVNAPMAYAEGKTPNLSMFPSADRNLGIYQPNAYPSETLNIKNPIAAFAVDALTDPAGSAGLGAGMARLGAGMARLGSYAGRQLSGAGTRLLNNPTNKLGKQLNQYRTNLIDRMYPGTVRDLGNVSLGSEAAKNAIRRSGTVIGNEGIILNPRFDRERRALKSSTPGEGSFRRAMLDRILYEAPVPSDLTFRNRSKTFNANMTYPNPADGTPGNLSKFVFVDNNKLAAGRATSEITSMIPNLEGEWTINPGSLSGDSYPLWHNILNRKIPNSPQFTITSNPEQSMFFNRMGKFSNLSQALSTATLEDSQKILDMTQRISEPTFQRYGITPPSNLKPGHFPTVTLHKRYKAGGVKRGTKKYITKN